MEKKFIFTGTIGYDSDEVEERKNASLTIHVPCRASTPFFIGHGERKKEGEKREIR